MSDKKPEKKPWRITRFLSWLFRRGNKGTSANSTPVNETEQLSDLAQKKIEQNYTDAKSLIQTLDNVRHNLRSEFEQISGDYDALNYNITEIVDVLTNPEKYSKRPGYLENVKEDLESIRKTIYFKIHTTREFVGLTEIVDDLFSEKYDDDMRLFIFSISDIKDIISEVHLKIENCINKLTELNSEFNNNHKLKHDFFKPFIIANPLHSYYIRLMNDVVKKGKIELGLQGGGRSKKRKSKKRNKKRKTNRRSVKA